MSLLCIHNLRLPYKHEMECRCQPAELLLPIGARLRYTSTSSLGTLDS